jgi:hypothetical protein
VELTKGNELLDSLLSSETKTDLLLLFHRNRGLIDTVQGVARRIGRKGDSVESDLNDLVELGVLGKKRIGKSEVVFMNRARDKEIQDIIASHMRNSNAGKED